MRAPLLLAFVALATTGCAAVPTEHVGVIEIFGAVQKDTWNPGLHLWGPWLGVHRISCRTQSLHEKTETPTGEGLVVGLDVSVVFHIRPESAKEVYSRYGGMNGMVDKVLTPEFRSCIRDVTAGFAASDLYSSRRNEVTQKMQDDLHRRMAARGVEIESVLLRGLSLPEQVANAVQAKLAADQQAQQMEFVLKKEMSEAQRKRIEAQGIADYQKIVNSGLSDRVLRWKGIEATSELAKSANTKVIVVGSGKDGLPLILGGQ